MVRATFTDGTNVPRIPPVRVGGGLFWRDANWLTRINLLHAFAQNDVAPIGETPTAGYNLLKAEVSYKTKLDPSWFGAREMMVGLVGNNLLNENIRNSGLLHQGPGPAAGPRRARVREFEVLSRKAERRTTADSRKRSQDEWQRWRSNGRWLARYRRRYRPPECYGTRELRLARRSLLDRGTRADLRFFAVGTHEASDAEEAILRYPGIVREDKRNARRRLSDKEIACLGLRADGVRPYILGPSWE